MPTCSLHGPHSGSRCFQCDLAEDLSRQRRAVEAARLYRASGDEARAAEAEEGSRGGRPPGDDSPRT